jgi:hypothetical protein
MVHSPIPTPSRKRRVGLFGKKAHFLVSYQGERLRHRSTTRQHDLGSQLGQWLEHKPPLLHAWVRHLQLAVGACETIVPKDIDVEASGAPPHQTLPAKLGFYALARRQQLGGRHGGLQLDHLVEIVILFRAAYRGRLIEAGGQ